MQRTEGETLVVQGQGHGTDTGRGVQVVVLGAARVLDAGRAHAARVEHAREQRRRLRHTGDDQEPLRVGHHAPAPRQQLGQRGPQPRQSARVRVAEGLVRQLRQHAALRGGPRRAREQRQVRCPRHEARPAAAGARGEIARAGPGRPRGVTDPGAGAPPAAQVPLGRQLLVRRRDQAPRDLEVGRQVPARRQAGARREPARADRVAQGRLKGPAARASRCRGGGQQQLPGRARVDGIRTAVRTGRYWHHRRFPPASPSPKGPHFTRGWRRGVAAADA